MTIKNPDQDEIQSILKTKKRIAVVGLSDKPERTSYGVAQYMKNNGYEIIPVNPNITETLGLKAYRSLQEIDGPVDIVNVFRRSEYLPDVARDAVEIGADVFWAQLGLSNVEAYYHLQEHHVTTIMDKCIKVEHAMGQ
jgi:predicted CoA-binding protein